jgi:Fur family ferric uptake transcriptional regulator
MNARGVDRRTNLSRADWLLRRLEDAGERMTEPREIVVRALVAQPGVINPEALSYELHPDGVGRATVYRTLDLLERYGMLARVHVDGCHGYTLCDEGHHHHLLCSGCNAVLPVDATGVEAEILRLPRTLVPPALATRADTGRRDLTRRLRTCAFPDETTSRHG